MACKPTLWRMLCYSDQQKTEFGHELMPANVIPDQEDLTPLPHAERGSLSMSVRDS